MKKIKPGTSACRPETLKKKLKRVVFPLFLLLFGFFLYLCNVHTHALGQMGEDSNILRSVIDALFLAI